MSKKMFAPNKFMGWKPELPDLRDYLYEKFFPTAPPKAGVVDLRSMCPLIYDQGILSSCTANAIAALLEFDRKKQKLNDFVPSRLFIYFNERMIEGNTTADDGAYIRDGIKSVVKYGYANESSWPYDEKSFAQKPNQKVYDEANKFKALKYFRLDNTNLDSLKSCLHDGYPFTAGLTLYPSFEDAEKRNGLINLPYPNEAPEGGHAISIVGYNDSNQTFILRNSWGVDAGDKGYYYIPYSYVTDSNLTDDCWTIRWTS